MVVFINPAAGGGSAVRKWGRIEGIIRSRFGEEVTCVKTDQVDVSDSVSRFLQEGVNRFVAAGGDGTVNMLVQAILDRAAPDHLERVKIGAIGLGSSNDFHKPFLPYQHVREIPCKLDFQRTVSRDIGVLAFKDDRSIIRHRYWILNAGIGITASANAFFNTPDVLLTWLKRRVTNLAILYAALRTIFCYRGYKLDISVGGEDSRRVNVANLGVVKSPHFAGNFCYDTSFIQDNRFFDIHLIEGVSIIRILTALWHLSHNRFSGLPGTRSWHTRSVTLEADTPFAVEYDGEVVQTRRVSFYLAPSQLQVCP